MRTAAALALLALAAPSRAVDLASLEKGQLQLKVNLLALYAAGGRPTQDAFSMRQARFTLEGRHPDVPGLSGTLMYETTRSTGLLDAYLECARKDVLPALAVKAQAGQTRRQFSHENLLPDAGVELINRSKVVEALVPGRDTRSLGRDLGGFVEAAWSPAGRERLLAATAGVFNGEGANTADRNKQKDVDLRVTSRLLPWLELGASYTRGRRGQPATVRDRRGAELLLEYGPFAARGEYVYGRDHLTLKDGWYSQAQCWLYKRSLLLVARYEEFDPDKRTAGDRQKQASYGLNLFPAKGLRLAAVADSQRDRVREDRGLFLASLSF